MIHDDWDDWKRAAWGLPKLPAEPTTPPEYGTDVVIEYAPPLELLRWVSTTWERQRGSRDTIPMEYETWLLRGTE